MNSTSGITSTTTSIVSDAVSRHILKRRHDDEKEEQDLTRSLINDLVLKLVLNKKATVEEAITLADYLNKDPHPAKRPT